MSSNPPLGAVLAGGRARRLGGAKATVRLAGRPLLHYPVQALQAVLDEVVVVAKPDTELPPVDVEVWCEPAEPHHPLVGIVHALACSGGRAVLVAAGDLPFLTPEVVRSLLDGPSAPAVIASGQRSGPQPLLGLYRPAAAALLAPAARAATAPARAAVLGIGAALVQVSEQALFNVNTARDLQQAASRM
jgi:molybdopterin-guanine dinucleotide biosynthesis protein A